MSIILMTFYIILALYHLLQAVNGRKKWGICYVTFAFIVFLISTFDYHNQHDMIYYASQYNIRDPLLDKNFPFYYIFLLLMKFGQIMGMSFETWLFSMSALFIILVIVSLKKHKYNPHLFLAFFMLNYVIVLYTGLKSFYGFCVFLLGVGYLYRGGIRNKIKFSIITCIAGGIHPMYYGYLIFNLINSGKYEIAEYEEDVPLLNNQLVRLMVAVSIGLSVFLRLTGSVNTFLGNIVASLNFEKLEGYMDLNTNMGFFIPVLMQLLSLFLAQRHKWYSRFVDNSRVRFADSLYATNLLQVFFYPLFMISVTFMRIITEYTLATITAVGYDFEELPLQSRKRIIGIILVIILFAYYRGFLRGNLWDTSVVPLFTNTYVHF